MTEQRQQVVLKPILFNGPMVRAILEGLHGGRLRVMRYRRKKVLYSLGLHQRKKMPVGLKSLGVGHRI